MVAGKEGDGFFQLGLQFLHKKVYKKKILSLITKNLNWNILTKNLFTFERWDGVKDESF